MNVTIYTTAGSVRGCCGHRHKSLLAAEMCLDRDQRGCNKAHGYSDRMVLMSNNDGVMVNANTGRPFHPHGPTCSALQRSNLHR